MTAKSESVVTRIAYSHALNAGKYAALEEQATRLGRVRSEVWQRFGSVAGAKESDHSIRDGWLKDGTNFGTLANPWKETVRDSVADIRANQAAAKVKVKRAIRSLPVSDEEKKRLYTALKSGTWADDKYLSRQMRKHCPRGKNRTHNQIVARSDNYTTRVEHGRAWVSVPGLEPRKPVRIPLTTNIEPTGTLRLILRDGLVEIHHQIPASELKSSSRPHGSETVGIDKGYTEVLADSDGDMHGEGFGDLLTAESDHRNTKGRRRNKIRSVAEKAEKRGDHVKAERIRKNNLGTKKRDRRNARFNATAKTVIYEAVHAIVDKADTVISEDLTWVGSGKKLGRKWNRRLSAWQKGVIATAVEDVTLRRGSAHALVNSAYTSQVDPRNGTFAVRKRDQLYCFDGVVMQADKAAARNILARMDDPDIHRYMPKKQVHSIIAERTRQHRSRLPDQDTSSSGGER